MVQIQAKPQSASRLAEFDLSPRTLPSPLLETRPRGVLIVDDDTAVRTMLSVGFRRFGFNVWPAADCRTAMETYRENCKTIDVALLDVLMPGRDGPATLADLRAINPYLHACFMTGQSGSYTEQDLFDCGVHAVYWKPIALFEVIVQIRALANTRTDSSNRA